MNNWIDWMCAGCCALFLLACDSPTKPPEYKCYNDGHEVDCKTGKPVDMIPSGGLTTDGDSTQQVKP